MATTIPKRNSEQLRVGTPVNIRWGVQYVHGVITEERGPIGIGGRKLYQVNADLGEGSSLIIELPASEIERLAE